VVDGIKNKEYLLSPTLRQLRQEASKLSVPLYSRKTKAVLIELIYKYQKNANQSLNKILTKNTPPKSSKLIPQTTTEEVKTKLVFLPRDPEWAYVFWEISDTDRSNAQNEGANRLCLRLADVTNSNHGEANPGTLQEVVVDSHSTEWYLPIPLGGRDYKVELGYQQQLLEAFQG
jgi:hypothetical protein